MAIDADVIVVGAGNAALSAAIVASEAGATVVVLEAAPHVERGGNSRFTGGLLRFAHEGIRDIVELVPDMAPDVKERVDIPAYPTQQMVADVMRLTHGLADEGLISIVAEQSRAIMSWYASLGIEFELYDKYVEHEGRWSWPDGAVLKTRGGGPSLVEALFAATAKQDIDIRYEHKVVDITSDELGVSLAVHTPRGSEMIRGKTMILGCGGFEASSQLRQEYLGEHWSHAKVRGTRHNTGQPLVAMLEQGAKPVGQWAGAHAVTLDASAPDYGDLGLGALTTRLSYPTGIMVNAAGERFTDEGADFKLLTYARIGEEILKQPEGWALQVFDQQTVPYIEERYALGAPPIIADSIDELAIGAGIDPAALNATITAYNAAVGEGRFDPSILDAKSTVGLEPPKSNWALRVDSPPYVGYKVACGITFTYGGLGIDDKARVLRDDDEPTPRIYATGEITGGFFYHNYPAGAGLMRGAVFGRIAGAEAARLVLDDE